MKRSLHEGCANYGLHRSATIYRFVLEGCGEWQGCRALSLSIAFSCTIIVRFILLCGSSLAEVDLHKSRHSRCLSIKVMC
jgi:hypothetical protein